MQPSAEHYQDAVWSNKRRARLEFRWIDFGNDQPARRFAFSGVSMLVFPAALVLSSIFPPALLVPQYSKWYLQVKRTEFCRPKISNYEYLLIKTAHFKELMNKNILFKEIYFYLKFILRWNRKQQLAKKRTEFHRRFFSEISGILEWVFGQYVYF